MDARPAAQGWSVRLHQATAGALYLHVPFCAQKCGYCDFSSWATDPADAVIGSYVRALERLVSLAADAGLLEGCATAYVGGGTPTLAGCGLAGIVSAINDTCCELQECTCEANPDSLGDELLSQLVEAGCTRLSVGVQSLDDDELRLLGRIHDAASAESRLKAAVQAGIDVSCDLMCAIPGQTDDSWRRSIERALATGVGHVSVYPLQIEEGTPFDARYGEDAPFNDPQVQAERMVQAREILEAAGYARYEVASYAQPGKACKHNVSYWTGVPYLGLGSSASSMLTREGYERLRACAPQLPRAGERAARIRLTCTDDRHALACATTLADLHFNTEELTEAEAAAEDLMLAMRMVRGADESLLSHAKEILGESRVTEALAWCERRGLARESDGSWRPTEQGWLLGNELYGRLWALADGC